MILADFTKAENTSPGTVSLAWNKNDAATGYEIAYSKDEEFETIISTVTISSRTTTTAEIKGLEKDETYYFHARAYTVQGGDTYYGQWSSLGTVKIDG